MSAHAHGINVGCLEVLDVAGASFLRLVHIGLYLVDAHGLVVDVDPQSPVEPLPVSVALARLATIPFRLRVPSGPTLIFHATLDELLMLKRPRELLVEIGNAFPILLCEPDPIDEGLVLELGARNIRFLEIKDGRSGTRLVLHGGFEHADLRKDRLLRLALHDVGHPLVLLANVEAATGWL